LEEIFNSQLENAGVEYFDFYLLHGLNSVVSDSFPLSNIRKLDEYDAWNFLKRIKAEGKAKHIGISIHDSAEVIDGLLTAHPEIEFVKLQINYADWNDPVIQSRLCYETVHKHGKPIIAMLPVKGGTLANLHPEVVNIFKEADPLSSPASWAIRYAASLDGVLTVLSGMSNLEQMKDNVFFMKNFKPLDEKEKSIIENVVTELHKIESIGGTGCKYCVDDCQQGINIPVGLDIMNDYQIYNRNKDHSRHRYRSSIVAGGKASDCNNCGLCVNHCPQKLSIPMLLKNAAILLEECSGGDW
jgi:predicted aldo/keto reductase-like oxidoreductase